MQAKFRQRLPMAPLSAAAVLVLAGTSCHNASRALPVGGDTATLKINLANLDSSDQGKTDWLYELSVCVPAITGALGTTNIVTFTAAGLHKGLSGCELRVKVVQPLPGITVAGDPNVLYWTKDLAITESADGSLTANAGLQKLYTATPPADTSKLITVSFPVNFPDPVPVNVAMSLQVTCTPQNLFANLFTQTGTAGATGLTSGSFSPHLSFDHEVDFVCSALLAIVDGKTAYVGSLSGDSGKLHGVPGQTVTATAVTLARQVPPTPPPSPTPSSTPPGDVSVSTTTASCDPPKIYDAVNHVCKDPPPN